MNETEAKSVSRSVSMPEDLWDLVDAHALTTRDGDRSTFIRRLVTENLSAAGKLPGSPGARVVAAALALLEIEEGDADAVLAVLKSRSQERLAARGKESAA